MMRQISARRSGAGALAAVLAVAAAAWTPSVPAAPFRAGAAVVDITPRNAPPAPPSIVAGGFLEARADRVHDPLYVRAIVLDDGGGGDAGREPVRIALVVVDSCMLPQPLLDEAKERAAAGAGMPPERMLISATHTHSAPAAMGCLGTRLDADYAATLPEAIAAAIVAAAGRLEPATIGHGAIDDWEHTHNRRWVRRPETRIVDPFGSATGLAHMHPGHLSRDVIGPSGPVDPQLSVISVRTARGAPLAVYGCYSQHYFGSPAVSADYFGHFCRVVAGGLGAPGDGNGPFVCALAQGTSGDLMWMDYGVAAEQPGIHEYAAAVARRALAALERIDHRDDVTLAMAQCTVELEYRVPDEARLAWARPIAAGIVDDVPRSIPEVYAREALILHERQRTMVTLQAIRIGDATIAALPTETYALTGLRLRNRSPAPLHFTVELANGAEGYIPPPEQHVLGGYTTWPARTAGLEVDAEPRIVAAVTELLEEVTGRPRRDQADVHGPAARAVLDARPIGAWRCEEDEGAELRSALDGGAAARLTPGFARYLPGVGAGTGTGAGEALVTGPFSGPDRINRSVHLAGGEVGLPARPAGDASLVAWIWLGERSGASRRSGTICTGLSAGPIVAQQDEHHVMRLVLGDAPGPTSSRADEWHQVVVVRRGASVTVHLDGRPEPELTGPAEAAGAALVVGAGLQGKVDELAVFDRPLSVDEIAALWRVSGVAEQHAAAAAARAAAEERWIGQAGVPEFPEDHAARLAALRPARLWLLERRPDEAVVTGAARFDPGAHGSFQGGRLAARDAALDAEWSAAFWFRNDTPAEARPVTAYLFSRGPDGDADAPGDHLGIGGTAPPTVPGRLLLFNGNQANGVLVGRTVIPPRSWNHVVVTRRGERMTVWLNGGSEPEIDGSLPPTAAGSTEFFLGARSDGFAPLIGHVAAFALFDRSLDTADAAAVFAASGRTPGQPVPVAEPEAEAPRTPEETRRGIRVPPGFRVELVAAEPDVIDPVAFDWDASGRLWVVEMADYPSGMDGAGAPGGRVRVLDDRDRDGRYETSTLFATGLSFPNGIVTWGDGVIVTAAPRILLLRDRDGDGICDEQETLLEGFMEGNQQLRVNGLRRGLDGTLWCASGGHHPGHGTETTIESPRSGRRHAVGSHDFRFAPDTGEVWVESGPSQFGRCRDPYGRWFGTQNANPLWQWVIPDRAVARNPFLAPERTIRHVLGSDSPPVRPASRPEKRFHSFEQAGRFTSACGATVDTAPALFADGRLHAFVCEPFHNLVQHDVLEDAGASFTAAWPEAEGPTDFFAADDGWCRPVMARIGPDGGLWIADMYRNVIEHPDWLPPAGRAELAARYRLGDDRGRIWRVVRDGSAPAIFPDAVRSATTPAARVACLSSPSTWRRDLAQWLLLHETPAADRGAVADMVRDLARRDPLPETRVQALWTLAGLRALDADLLVAALADPDPRVREQALQLAAEQDDPRVIAAAVAVADDPDPKVCLQLALACGAWSEPAAADALATIARRFADDPLVRTAVGTAALAHVDRFAAAIAAEEPAVADAYRDGLVRMTAGRRDRGGCAQFLAAALDAAPPQRHERLESALQALQRLGCDPWSLLAAGTGPAEPLAAALERVAEALAAAATVAADAGRPADERYAAARLLCRTDRTREEGCERLAAWLGPRSAADVQQEVLTVLSESGAPTVSGLVGSAWPALGPAARTRAIDVWLSRPAWTSDLLDRLAAGGVAVGSLSLPQRQRLQSHPDADLAARAATLLATGPTTNRREVVSRYGAALSGAGDASRGREVYLRACAACHRRGDAGREVGPNLATVAEHAAERLLANILDPNADIQPGFQASTCVLGTGEVVAGIVAGESGGSLTMKLADGSVRTIARDEIDELVTTNTSFMPEGIEETVTVDQMRDLLAFLRGDS